MASEQTPSCWICCEGELLISTGCACRGSAGFVHLPCLVAAATHDVDLWTTCPLCRQEYTGEADLGLARARWELVCNRPAEDEERLFVANNLAVTLKESGGDDAGALRLMEEVLAVRRRTLGDEHAYTLDSIINLALQHYEMGALSAALPLGEEAVAATRRTLGKDLARGCASASALSDLVLVLDLPLEDRRHAVPAVR